jgi:hypothetical protein
MRREDSTMCAIELGFGVGGGGQPSQKGGVPRMEILIRPTD